MKKFDQLKSLSESDFRRLTGVKRSTFDLMLTVYERELLKLKKLSGRPSALSTADQLLMMLEYNREYRTYFHIATSYGLSESNAYRCIKRAEELLIRSGQFSLPGRKALAGSETSFEIILVDVTEAKIERPKKNNETAILARKSNTASKSKP